MLSPIHVETTPSRVDDRLNAYFVELADLTMKKQALRSVHKMLQTNFKDHPNLCHFLKCVERGAAAIDRRCDMIMLALKNGVL